MSTDIDCFAEKRHRNAIDQSLWENARRAECDSVAATKARRWRWPWASADPVRPCRTDVMERRRWVAIPQVHPFEQKNYREFAFLADVRNEWGIPPIAQPRGIPVDASVEAVESLYNGYDSPEGHSRSWLTIEELTEFHYDATFENLVPTVTVDGGDWSLEDLLRLDGPTLETHSNSYDKLQLIDAVRDARITTYREFLGPGFFAHLEELKVAGTERIIFWFY